MKALESFERVGVMPHRSYYIPFAEEDAVRTKYGIPDRSGSSRFENSPTFGSGQNCSCCCP